MSAAESRRLVAVQAPRLRMRRRDRARLQQVARLLSPGSAVVDGSTSAPPASAAESYMPFPSWRGVRALVPVAPRRAAASAVGLRVAGQWSLRAVTYRAAALGMRTGLLQQLQRERLQLAPDGDAGADEESLAEHVGHLLGTPVQLAATVGRVDPHRTVALHVLDGAGRLVAFGKVTDNPLSTAQLRTEAEVLRQIEEHGTRLFEAPRLLHCESWRGMQLLLTSPLDLAAARRPDRDRPPGADVLLEVASTRSWPREPLARSEYWSRTRRRLDAMGDAADGHPGVTTALALAASIEEHLGGEVVALGAWHGDWLPWNMAWQGGCLLAWDWEYATDCAPVGFDAFHYVCGALFFRHRTDAGTALREAWRRASPALHDAGLSERETACVHALYGLEFLLRRLDIVTAGGGADDSRVFPGIGAAVEESLLRARAGVDLGHVDGPAA